MHVRPLKTHAIAPSESLHTILDVYVPVLPERAILFITSKVVSLCEGRVVAKEGIDKALLVRENAEAYLKSPSGVSEIQLTIKQNILIPSAGIDESNGNGKYILYPEDVQKSAASIWEFIRQRDSIRDFGVVITDSHLTPLRRGVVGIGLGWCGFKATNSYVGKPDCFGVPLRVTAVNVIDALAAAAVFCMGEGSEQTPLAIITDAAKITFQNSPPTPMEVKELSIPLKEDIFAPLLYNSDWVYNKSNNFNI